MRNKQATPLQITLVAFAAMFCLCCGGPCALSLLLPGVDRDISRSEPQTERRRTARPVDSGRTVANQESDPAQSELSVSPILALAGLNEAIHGDSSPEVPDSAPVEEIGGTSPRVETAARAEPARAPQAPTTKEKQFRTWSSADGSYTVVAALVATKEGWVQLERESGERLPIPLEKLSPADIEFVTGKRPVNVIEGDVIAITDGDTMVVLDTSKVSHKIRLEGLDAPESKQDYGTKARQALADKVFRKQVRVEWEEKDKYDRTLGHIYLDDRWINKEMIEDGWAWHYVEYNQDERLATAQAVAKQRKAGLWADVNRPVPPWIFRHPEKLAEYNAQMAAERVQEPQMAVQGFVPAQLQQSDGSHWLNTSSNVRHNSGCRHFGNTKSGRYCGPNEGKACGICGG